MGIVLPDGNWIKRDGIIEYITKLCIFLVGNVFHLKEKIFLACMCLGALVALIGY